MPQGTPRDKKSPTVSILFPASGAVISNTSPLVTITASAVDNKAIGRVDFYIDNVYIASDTIPSYQANWYITNAVGTHSITAKAVDTSGNFATHTIPVTIIDGASSSTTTTTGAPYVPPTLPSSKILNVPPAFIQGAEASSTSIACAILRSVEQYYTTGATSYSASVNIMSPEFHYDNCVSISNDCTSGSNVIVGFNYIYDSGICRLSALPYSDQNGCNQNICTQASYDDAANYKLANYTWVLSSNVYAIKRMLCNNHAGIFNFQADSNFYNGGASGDCNFIWNSRGTLMGNNAYNNSCTVIGYDDSKQAWLIQANMGPNWGCNGKMWVDYSFFSTITTSVYYMTTRQDQNYFPII